MGKKHYAIEFDALKAAGRIKGRGPLLVFCEPYHDSGKFHVRLWKGKAAKNFANYLFRSLAAANDFIAAEVEKARYAAEAEEAHKAEKKRRIAEMGERLTVGTILHYSWGYDQTNCDYFQIVARRGMTVHLRSIAAETVEGSEGFMSCRKRPVRDRFTDEKIIVKRITPYGVSFDFGSGRPVADNETADCTWYA